MAKKLKNREEVIEMLIRACCECVRHLPKGKEHESIIGCYRDGETFECASCPMLAECGDRLVYTEQISHGLCDEHFKAAMDNLNERRRHGKKGSKDC